MLESRRFPFIERSNTPGVSSNMPYLPLTLTHKNRSLDVVVVRAIAFPVLWVVRAILAVRFAIAFPVLLRELLL